jgi:ABC-type sugar transport system ATPase subunit
MVKKPIVSMKNISKKFGGTQALDNVSIDIYPGEIHSFVGVNGAGKSTLMKILLGVFPPDSGRILISGKEVSFKSPVDAINSGISMVFQELNLFPKMTVAENILLGKYPTNHGIISWENGYKIVKDFLDSIKINLDPKIKVEKLSLAERQLVEIAKSAFSNPKILILDEPSSSLSYEEEKILYELIKRLKEKGLAIIFITHKMEEIFDLSDRITVIRDGKKVSEGKTSEYNIDKLTELMLGQAVDIFERKKTENKDFKETVLAVENLKLPRVLYDISFELKKGEILAITGLVGSGKSELGRSLFGVYGKINGKVLLEGKEIFIKCPGDAINHNIGYLPISRKDEGILKNFDVRKNITITILEDLGFFVKRVIENDICKKMIQLVNVRPPKPDLLIESLSGGNQQKVILSRWLAKKQKILILDEPTRGIDVGAKQEIYTTLKMLAKEGMSVMLISSEIEEILNVSDRILIMREGKIIKELKAGETDRREILKYSMAGLSKAC